MFDKIVSFPGLGWELHFSSALVTIGSKPIYWYGVLIAFGFLFAAVFCSRRARRFGCTPDHVSDIVLLLVPIGIGCARLYYVFFEWSYYSQHPSEIIAIWNGGLAIYGGVIGGVLTVLVYCRVKHLDVLLFMDNLVSGLIFGQAVGRWGNFFNCEAFGRETTLPWRMCIGKTLDEAGGVGNHPTFFYESAWNLCGFVLLQILGQKRKYRGQCVLFYFAWYGLGRFWIEGLRTDSLYIPGTAIRISQVVALVTFLLCGGTLLVNHFRPFLRPVSDGEAA